MLGVRLGAAGHRHRGRGHRRKRWRLGHGCKTLKDQCKPRQQPDHPKATRALNLVEGRHHGPSTLSWRGNGINHGVGFMRLAG